MHIRFRAAPVSQQRLKSHLKLCTEQLWNSAAFCRFFPRFEPRVCQIYIFYFCTVSLLNVLSNRPAVLGVLWLQLRSRFAFFWFTFHSNKKVASNLTWSNLSLRSLPAFWWKCDYNIKTIKNLLRWLCPWFRFHFYLLCILVDWKWFSKNFVIIKSFVCLFTKNLIVNYSMITGSNTVM